MALIPPQRPRPQLPKTDLTQMNVLKVAGLTKRYCKACAVDQVTFDVRRCEIMGLLGPNGAGKTTIINMILGVLQPDAGTIVIEGCDMARQRSRALAHTMG